MNIWQVTFNEDIVAIGNCYLSGCHEPYNVLISAITGTTASVNWERIDSKWGTTSLNSCDSSAYGETEDYCINITQFTGIITDKALPNTTLNVYPSPFDHQLMVQMNSKQKQVATLTLNTITGQEIINLTPQLDLGENILQLPTNSLHQEVYLIRLLLEDGSIMTQKVIKQ